jgi:translation initiation factor 1 (eIF-1/SUI1)
MKKQFCCAVTVKKDDGDAEIIQMQGDHRSDIATWLVANEVLTKSESESRIVIHGA